jgi:hypothetical protein
MKPSAMKHRPGRRPNISDPQIRASDRKSPSPVEEEVGSGHPTTKSHTDSSASKQKRGCSDLTRKMKHRRPRTPTEKAPTSLKTLEENASGMKKRRANLILLRRRLLRPAVAAQTHTSRRTTPPARPGSTTSDGEQTLAPPPDLDDEQTQELGPNPTIYTSARRFADLPSSTMPWLPPEGRKAGEIAAGNAIRPLLAFCNCSRGEEAKSREARELNRSSFGYPFRIVVECWIDGS